jgi:hypothetical protein
MKEVTQETLALRSITDNVIVLANIIEATKEALKDVAGKDVADTMGESRLTEEVLTVLVVNEIKNKLTA